MPKRILQGVVYSAVNDKSVTVRVERKYRHSTYNKIVKSSKKYAVHDPSNKHKVGDVVTIQESRPISKTKFWVLVAQ